MKDRVPKYKGRVLITPENGSAPYYATIARADEPVEEGTPLNKVNLLSDTTSEVIFQDSKDHTVDEALSTLNSNTKQLDLRIQSDTIKRLLNWRYN